MEPTITPGNTPAEPVLPNPRGSEEDLAEAIKILTDGKIIDRDKRQKLYDEVKSIAQWLLSDLDSEAKGIRISDAQLRLSEIQKKAEELRSAMNRLHPSVLQLVQSAIKHRNYLEKNNATPIQLDVNNLVQTLDAVIEAAGLAKKWLGPDRGGKHNLYIREWGSARRHMVYCCADLLEQHRGIQDNRGVFTLSGTNGGALHKLVCAVWSYATGEDGEDTGLIRHVQSVVRGSYKHVHPDDPGLFEDSQSFHRQILRALGYGT